MGLVLNRLLINKLKSSKNGFSVQEIEMVRNQQGNLKLRNIQKRKEKELTEKNIIIKLRQKMADERMQIKRRFFTWKQAITMLDADQSKKEWNDYFRIKALLQLKDN
ncbi:unnamed protein product [Paramecium sonneborni]|uniref:Uncharacterized protein n=1 Tax=Paramecium sonneborni TaxID=65129 RepID=A0A8S1QPF1_9CILI|nr:unnamed protein product [Paramecium sonneborni]